MLDKATAGTKRKQAAATYPPETTCLLGVPKRFHGMVAHVPDFGKPAGIRIAGAANDKRVPGTAASVVANVQATLVVTQ